MGANLHFIAFDWPTRPFATWDELEAFSDEVDESMLMGGLAHNAGATGVFSEWILRTGARLGLGDKLVQRNDVCPDQAEHAFPSAGGLTAAEVADAARRVTDLEQRDFDDEEWLPDLVDALVTASRRGTPVLTLYC